MLSVLASVSGKANFHNPALKHRMQAKALLEILTAGLPARFGEALNILNNLAHERVPRTSDSAFFRLLLESHYQAALADVKQLKAFCQNYLTTERINEIVGGTRSLKEKDKQHHEQQADRN